MPLGITRRRAYANTAQFDAFVRAATRVRRRRMAGRSRDDGHWPPVSVSHGRSEARQARSDSKCRRAVHHPACSAASGRGAAGRRQTRHRDRRNGRHDRDGWHARHEPSSQRSDGRDDLSARSGSDTWDAAPSPLPSSMTPSTRGTANSPGASRGSGTLRLACGLPFRRDGSRTAPRSPGSRSPAETRVTGIAPTALLLGVRVPALSATRRRSDGGRRHSLGRRPRRGRDLLRVEPAESDAGKRTTSRAHPSRHRLGRHARPRREGMRRRFFLGKRRLRHRAERVRESSRG